MLHLLAADVQPTDYTIGGVAVAVVTFAGTVVKLVLGMLEAANKRADDRVALERTRGDRLEAAALQAIPALTSATIQAQSNQDLIKQMGQQMIETARKAN